MTSHIRRSRQSCSKNIGIISLSRRNQTFPFLSSFFPCDILPLLIEAGASSCQAEIRNPLRYLLITVYITQGKTLALFVRLCMCAAKNAYMTCQSKMHQ